MKFLIYVMLACAFVFVGLKMTEYDNSQHKKCEDKGMILVKPWRDKPYCAIGTRP